MKQRPTIDKGFWLCAARLLAFGLGAVGTACSGAFAATSTSGAFQVAMIIEAECTLSSTRDIKTEVPALATREVGVQCTNATPYRVSIENRLELGEATPSAIDADAIQVTVTY